MGLKVLHLIDSGGLYGAEKMLLSLVNEQLKQGLEPMILSAGEPGLEEKSLEAEACRLGLPVTPWRMNPGLNLLEARKIIAWAREQGYELMHSHGYKFNILIGIWPQWTRLPLITTLHGYVRAPRFSKMWLYEMLDRLVLPRMQAVVLVNEPMKADLGSALQASERVHIVPNGVDIPRIENQAKEEPSPELNHFFQVHSPVILGVGRLSREKGFERLIESFSAIRTEYPEAGLLIVGEGRLRNELEALLRKYGLEHSVLMPGFYGNVPALMARASALAMPSKTEGLPITLLEAMTLRLPIIASAVGAVPEVLDHGKGGWIVRELEASNLATALLECLEDVDQQDWRVRRALNRVQQTYSSKAMATAYCNIYRQVAA